MIVKPSPEMSTAKRGLNRFLFGLSILACLFFATRIAQGYSSTSVRPKPVRSIARAKTTVFEKVTNDAALATPVSKLSPAMTVPDLEIQTMLDQVLSSTVRSYNGGLSGEWPVLVSGQPYTIETRYTYSGLPIQQATTYVGQHMEGLGLDVEYDQWEGATYPNVIGELKGQVCPDEIYIMSAHLDSISRTDANNAPGADDNGSGSSAVLVAADILSQYTWGPTLRFALWTGEEQYLRGSRDYAEEAHTAGDNIAGVINLDMIGWKRPGSDPIIELHANSALTASIDLAQLFTGVVDAYELDLIPDVLVDNFGRSDHVSFWNYDYPAILAIEDLNGSNPYNPNYHTVNDRLDTLDMAYFTEFVRGAIGTMAHLGTCSGDQGKFQGQVTNSINDEPVLGAEVEILDSLGRKTMAFSGIDGYFAQILPSGRYSVTVTSFVYYPSSTTDLAISTDTVTTINFSLIPWPKAYMPLFYADEGSLPDGG